MMQQEDLGYQLLQDLRTYLNVLCCTGLEGREQSRGKVDCIMMGLFS